MKKFSSNLISKSISKALGSGKHFLHEPYLRGNEIKYLKNTIKNNFVSTSGKYVNLFENKISKYTKSKSAIAVVNGTQAIFISLKACGVDFMTKSLYQHLLCGNSECHQLLRIKASFVDSNIKNFIDCDKLNYQNNINCKIKCNYITKNWK